MRLRRRAGHHHMTIAVDKNSNLRFWATLAVAFCVTASYPAAMLGLFPTEYVFQYLRNEVAWSFHAVFLIPIAAGLLARVFNPNLLFGLEFWKRCTWVFVFLAPLVPLFFAVIAD